MLFNETHLIKEAEVRVGEIVEDDLEKKAFSLAGLAGTGKVGAYLSTAAGKQLASRVGTGMAVGAAGGLLTAKEGERGSGAIKGALLGGLAGGAYHAVDSGALSRFNIGGQDVGATLGRNNSLMASGHDVSKLAPEMQAKMHGLLKSYNNVEQVAAGAPLQHALNVNQNTGFARNLRRSVAGEAGHAHINAVLPHVEGADKGLLSGIADNIQGLGNGGKGRISGSQGLGLGTRFAGFFRGKTWLQQRNIESAAGLLSGHQANILEGSVSGLRNQYAGLLGSIEKPLAQAATSVPHAGGGLPTRIAPMPAQPMSGSGGSASFTPAPTWLGKPPQPRQMTQDVSGFNGQMGARPSGTFMPQFKAS